MQNSQGSPCSGALGLIVLGEGCKQAKDRDSLLETDIKKDIYHLMAFWLQAIQAASPSNLPHSAGLKSHRASRPDPRSGQARLFAALKVS